MAPPATSCRLRALADPHEREAIAHELQSTMPELVASWRDLADVRPSAGSAA